MAFDVLMPQPGMPVIVDRLEPRVRLHKLWQAADREAALAAIAPNIRAIVSTFDGAVDAELMRRLPRLEIVSSFGVGYDHVDAAWAGQHGIVVTHTPGVLDEDVADIAIALTLAAFAACRRPIAICATAAGRSGAVSADRLAATAARWAFSALAGSARRSPAAPRRSASKIAYHGRHRQDDVAYPYHPTPLALAEACDILMVAAPGGPATRHVVDAPRSRRARRERRAGQYRARLAGRRSGADRRACATGRSSPPGSTSMSTSRNVPAELIALDNVVLLPHVGSATHHSRNAMANLVVDNLLSWVDGKGPLTPTPETPWRR